MTMRQIHDQILDSQQRFATLLESYLVRHETTVEQYIRYLSFQYHLTRGVQRYFMAIAAHPDLARRRRLREFLYNFSNEEELHYLVAANDLHKIGVEPLAVSFDVELWHAYFTQVVVDRPFVRLGAATILENISNGPARPWVTKALRGPFLTKDNTKFLVLHQHETLPHGDQILEAIEHGNLDERQFADLHEGALKGTVLYLRMAEWALRPDVLSAICDVKPVELHSEERARIAQFDMAELEVY